MKKKTQDKKDKESGNSKALRIAKREHAYTKYYLETYFREHKVRPYQIISFLGPNGHEANKIVDMLAIRKDSKSDKLEIILIDIKGSGRGKPGKPTPNNIERLRTLYDVHHAKGIVLAQYQKDKENKEWLKFYKIWEPNADPLKEQLKVEEIFK